MASRKQPLKGVNLGGWLVLEPWMTPALFKETKAVDEYTYCGQASRAQKEALKQFRDTFITEHDFEWLAEQGIEAVRLPVGYWLFGGEGPYVKTDQYVDKVFEWASVHGLSVLLDLHGAPGSQNGKMHSGQVGEISWDSSTANIAKTITVAERIAKRYGKHPALLGISLLNEPSPTIKTPVLQNFYRQARQILQPLCRPEVWIVMSDNFKPHRWRGRLPELHMDHHQYQVFTSLDKRLPIWAQLLRTRFRLPRRLKRYSRWHPFVIGEWSLVLRGERRPDKLRAYGRLQQKAFAGRVDAWFYWNYKTQQGGTWNFRDCIEKGLLTID